MFGMGILHSAAGPIEKVFILVSPRVYKNMNYSPIYYLC